MQFELKLFKDRLYIVIKNIGGCRDRQKDLCWSKEIPEGYLHIHGSWGVKSRCYGSARQTGKWTNGGVGTAAFGNENKIKLDLLFHIVYKNTFQMIWGDLNVKKELKNLENVGEYSYYLRARKDFFYST